MVEEYDEVKNKDTADNDPENWKNAENGDSVGKLSHKRTKKNQLEGVNLEPILESNCEKLQITTTQKGVILKTVVQNHRISFPAAVVNEVSK